MDLLQTLVGAAAFATAVGGALWILGRFSHSSDLLAPVVVGGLLRLAVMVMAHVGSLHLGDEGFFFIDDRTYTERGGLLADAWRDGTVANPSAYNYGGSYQFGYSAVVGVAFTLIDHSIIAAKLINVLAGTTTILLTGLLAGRVIGEHAQRRAAWAAALFPTLVWWSAPLLKEAVTTTLVVAFLLAATYIPRRTALAATGALFAALAVTRTGAAVAVLGGCATALGLAARRSPAIGWKHWLRAFGGVTCVVLVGAVVLSGGHLGDLVDQYTSTIDNMIELYQGSNPLAIPGDIVKTLITPFPWAFDADTRNWDRPLYPGVWALILALPLAAYGAWRVRAKPELALVVVPLVLTVTLNAFTSGVLFRQRSVVEPLIVVLAVAGMTSYRQATRWGSLALGITAVVATAHTRSPATGLAIAAAGACLWLISRRLPGAPLDGPSEGSAMVESLDLADA